MTRTLVIETATAACSVALIEGGAVIDERHELVGRGHAERLVPMIAELADEGRATLILVDCGPGSFTGVRVGLAAARALALGWSADVRGFSSLALIAAGIEADGPVIATAITGGHGEIFVQRHGSDLQPIDEMVSLTPDVAAQRIGEHRIFGSGAAALVAARGRGEACEAWPRAADAVRLPPALAALAPSPLYGRAPDARLPA